MGAIIGKGENEGKEEKTLTYYGMEDAPEAEEGFPRTRVGGSDLRT